MQVMLHSYKIRALLSWKFLSGYYVKTTMYCSCMEKKSSSVVAPVTVNGIENKEHEISALTIITKHNQMEQKLDSTNSMWHPSPIVDKRELFNHYKKLSKFRLTSLVVITSMAGYAMAPAPFTLSTFVMCSLGTGFVSAAANAINQYHEVPFDSQMSRTKSRVLVTGKLTPLHSVGFALISATCGLSFLYFGVNSLAATLSAVNLFLYTSVYTPMKRMTILNTWVGSVVGAIPPLIGWSSCCGTLDIGSFILAGMLFAWQFPHFNALSWNLRPDYSRAGYRMMAVTNPGLCRRTTVRYTFAIIGLSCLSSALEITNIWFSLVTIPLNGYFCYLAYLFYRKSDSATSRKLFRFSLIHLPLLMTLFLLCKTRWFFMDCDTQGELKESRTLINLSQHKDVMKKNTDSVISLTSLNRNPPNACQHDSVLPLTSSKAN